MKVSKPRYGTKAKILTYATCLASQRPQIGDAFTQIFVSSNNQNSHGAFSVRVSVTRNLVKIVLFLQYFCQNFSVLAIFVSKLFLSGNLSSVKIFQNFSSLAFFSQSFCHGLYSAVIALAKPLFLFNLNAKAILFQQPTCQTSVFSNIVV